MTNYYHKISKIETHRLPAGRESNFTTVAPIDHDNAIGAPDQVCITTVITPEVPEVPAVPEVLDEDGNVVTEGVPAIPAVPAVTEDHWELNLEAITPKRIDALWVACNAYKEYRINSDGFTICVLNREISPKSLAICTWIDELWVEYYVRRADIVAGAEPNLDFTSHGELPYTFAEAKAEADTNRGA